MSSILDVEITDRVKRIRKSLRDNKVSAAVITSKSSVHYFSGFSGTDAFLLITQKSLTLFSDSRYTEEAERSAPLFRFVLWRKHPTLSIGKIIKGKKIKKVLFEENSITQDFYAKLVAVAKDTMFVQGGRCINKIRDIKSKYELRLIKKALRIAEASLLTTIKKIKIGMLETEISLELEYAMRKNGAEGIAFPTIVAIDSNSSLPHAHPGKKKIKGGSILLIDWGARYGFYNSDLTRTLFVDSIPKIWNCKYLRVLEAQQLAISKIKAGVLANEVDAIARDCLKQDGLDEFFSHSLGHGVGIDIHERPTLSKINSKPLNEGEVITVEPGVYFPGKGGIRIEDMVVVRKNKAEVLSCLPRDLNQIVI